MSRFDSEKAGNSRREGGPRWPRKVVVNMQPKERIITELSAHAEAFDNELLNLKRLEGTFAGSSSLFFSQRATLAEPDNPSDDLASWAFSTGLTSTPHLRECNSTVAQTRWADANGVQPRLTAICGGERGSPFIENQARLADGSERGATRPKSFSPRAGVHNPGQLDDCQWLSTKGAARYLDASVGAIRNMVWRGQLTVYKLPNGRLRFKKSELDRQLESSRKQGGFNGR